MILSDFLTLEVYFDNHESAQFFEECSKKYGADLLNKYINRGALERRPIYIGPDAGRSLLCLTRKGREMASLKAS